MVRADLSWVLRRRLAVQRLTSAGLASGVDAVRLLTCVQAQDAPLAAWSLGMRTRRSSYSSILAEQATGSFVRTHILRPTWHYVAAEDLRWILRLTSPKAESAMGARHRQLDLDATAIDRGIDALGTLLQGQALTRKQIGALGVKGLPRPGEHLGHMLLVAEMRGVICSGPPRGTEHTYALIDEVIAPTWADDLDRDEAVRRLVHRFFLGHGPATDRDMGRWCTLTLTEIRAACADLVRDGELESIEVDGQIFWHDPATPPRTTRAATLLLPVFDEAFLTYPHHNFPRPSGVALADRSRIFAQAGGGVVLVEGRDVGMFRRTARAGAARVEVVTDEPLLPEAVEAPAGRLARFFDKDLELEVLS